MKNFKILALYVIVITLIGGCSKDKDDPKPNQPWIGTWSGIMEKYVHAFNPNTGWVHEGPSAVWFDVLITAGSESNKINITVTPRTGKNGSIDNQSKFSTSGIINSGSLASC